jgi:hypothetical protein
MPLQRTTLDDVYQNAPQCQEQTARHAARCATRLPEVIKPRSHVRVYDLKAADACRLTSMPVAGHEGVSVLLLAWYTAVNICSQAAHAIPQCTSPSLL